MEQHHWRLTAAGAQAYQDFIVPAILGPAAQALLDNANLRPSQVVLDAGCGTGAATRLAAEAVGPGGRVIGLDVSPEMIEVARSISTVQAAPIEYQEHTALELPLPDALVDVVLLAQSLQFVPNRRLALAEMYRVLKPGGGLYMSLWTDLHASPYFLALFEALAGQIGPDAAAPLKAIFSLSDSEGIEALLTGAGFGQIRLNVAELEMKIPSLEEFLPAQISATPIQVAFQAAPSDRQNAVLTDLAARLEPHRQADGFHLRVRSHLVQARKPH